DRAQQQLRPRAHARRRRTGDRRARHSRGHPRRHRARRAGGGAGVRARGDQRRAGRRHGHHHGLDRPPGPRARHAAVQARRGSLPQRPARRDAAARRGARRRAAVAPLRPPRGRGGCEVTDGGAALHPGRDPRRAQLLLHELQHHRRRRPGAGRALRHSRGPRPRPRSAGRPDERGDPDPSAHRSGGRHPHGALRAHRGARDVLPRPGGERRAAAAPRRRPGGRRPGHPSRRAGPGTERRV
ncbi:MAG: hypothetical protein AVDCRST_MAG24-1366, partial [uncultured Nocardioidaceae bacterium]